MAGDKYLRSNPAWDVAQPVLHDTGNLTSLVNGEAVLRFDEAGDVKLTSAGGSTQLFTVEAGEVLPLLVARVWNTSTDITADKIKALYHRKFRGW